MERLSVIGGRFGFVGSAIAPGAILSGGRACPQCEHTRLRVTLKGRVRTYYCYTCHYEWDEGV